LVPIPSKTKTVAKAEMDFGKIKQLLKIIETESCLLIYAHLMLFGRTTPAKLREVTGLSKATMFRNLALLYDAEILAKEEVTVPDRRYGLHYYISKNLMDVAKRLFSRSVQNYAVESGNQDLFERWAMALETLPLALNRFTTELILKVAQIPVEPDTDECIVITKMVAFRVGDITDTPVIIEKIRDLVKAFEKQGRTKRRNWKKPLSQPATMTVSLVAMSGEVPTDPNAIVAKRIEC
jgi:DNA-binding transcriptional ArsR family regulator